MPRGCRDGAEGSGTATLAARVPHGGWETPGVSCVLGWHAESLSESSSPALRPPGHLLGRAFLCFPFK